MRNVRNSLSLLLTLSVFLFFSIQSAMSVIAVLSAIRIFLRRSVEFSARFVGSGCISAVGEELGLVAISGVVVFGSTSLGCMLGGFTGVGAGSTAGRSSGLGLGEVWVRATLNTPWLHPVRNAAPLIQNGIAQNKIQDNAWRMANTGIG